MKTKMTWNPAGILFAAGMLCVLSAVILAADYDFVGTWKGEYTPAAGAAPPAGGAAPAGRGGFGGAGAGGPQKVTLRVKVKNDKATGNFTMGASATEDIREGRVEGNKLSFKTGVSPAATYDNEAVMNGEELLFSRTASGGRGGRPQSFTLKRNK